MVSGIQFWAESVCRSMLSFYEAMGLAYQVPFRICVIDAVNEDRSALGWAEDEFSHLELVVVGESFQRAKEELEARKDWHQVFGAYQANAIFQRLILKAKSLGTPVGVCSESPLNMLAPGLKRMAKSVYIDGVLPRKMRPYVTASDFVINLSGSGCLSLLNLGWKPQQVIPCGYFPPPLDGSEFRERITHGKGDFHVLCTGGLSWHRGQDVLLKAIKLLKDWGVYCKATITQIGPEQQKLMDFSEEHRLAVDFVGMLPMSELIAKMEECSCYVGTGREEPWGIRVNDAIHCGAPLLVSRGMGAGKLVDDYGCGMTFNSGDYVDLAWRLRSLIEDKETYFSISSRLKEASRRSMPKIVAAEVVGFLANNFTNWSKSH